MIEGLRLTIPGDGVGLLRAGKALANSQVADDNRTGVNIIARCKEPVRQISGNAGHEGSIVVEKIRANASDFNHGVNAATGENASSISGLILTTEAMICESPRRSRPRPRRQARPGRHGLLELWFVLPVSVWVDES